MQMPYGMPMQSPYGCRCRPQYRSSTRRTDAVRHAGAADPAAIRLPAAAARPPAGSGRGLRRGLSQLHVLDVSRSRQRRRRRVADRIGDLPA